MAKVIPGTTTEPYAFQPQVDPGLRCMLLLPRRCLEEGLRYQALRFDSDARTVCQLAVLEILRSRRMAGPVMPHRGDCKRGEGPERAVRAD